MRERGLKTSIFEAHKNLKGDFEMVFKTRQGFDGSGIIKYPWTVWGEAPAGRNNGSYNCMRAGNVFYGIVQKYPESIGVIEYESDTNGGSEVRVRGENRGGKTKAETMQIVVMEGGTEKEAIEKYERSLPKSKYGMVENSLFVCTWASLGLEVSQKMVVEQARAAVELKEQGMRRIDYFIVDDGYQRDFIVGNDFDKRRFPHPFKMFEEIEKLGIKPGLWVAPFHTMDEELSRQHPEWFINNVSDPLLTRPISWHGIPVRKKARIFDISNDSARKHIIDDLARKASLGVKIFKLDFLYGPMMYELADKEHTPRAYWHQFFDELRDKLPRDVILMGCGVPVFDSFEFEVNRTSGDTAAPRFSGFRFSGLMGRILRNKIKAENNWCYAYSFKTADLIGKLVVGATMDGIHFNLGRAGVPMSSRVREGVNSNLRRLRGAGVTNFFLGDDPRKIVGRSDIVNFVNDLMPAV